jgi:hypothetical protein
MYNRLITLRQVASLLGVVQILRFLLTRLLGAPTLTVKLAADGAPLTIRFNNSDLVLLLGVFLHGDCHLSLQPPPALILDLYSDDYAGALPLKEFPEIKPESM